MLITFLKWLKNIVDFARFSIYGIKRISAVDRLSFFSHEDEEDVAFAQCALVHTRLDFHWGRSVLFIPESVFCTESVLLSLRFIPESVFYTQSVIRSPQSAVRSPAFMLTARQSNSTHACTWSGRCWELREASQNMCEFIFAVIADCKLRTMHEG